MGKRDPVQHGRAQGARELRLLEALEALAVDEEASEKSDTDAFRISRRARENRKAGATFDAFPPSHQREYLEWIVEAKRDETRDRRIADAVEWIAAGKPRNWKYL